MMFRNRHAFIVLLILLSISGSSLLFAGGSDRSDLPDATIRGDYLEVRTADVWTGPCFANGEVNLVGKEGILAWNIKRGSWEGVPLDGLKVVAVVRASATLGDPFSDQLPAKSVIITDVNANQEQKSALVGFVKKMGGPLVQDVAQINSSRIEMDNGKGSGFAMVKAGDIVEIKTRALNHHDLHCGNEFIYYPPLTKVESAQPAYALTHRFSGEGLNRTWSCPLKRSAFVGTFAY